MRCCSSLCKVLDNIVFCVYKINISGLSQDTVWIYNLKRVGVVLPYAAFGLFTEISVFEANALVSGDGNRLEWLEIVVSLVMPE